MISSIKDFLRLESASGILLLIAAILAMIAQNSPLSDFYNALLSVPVQVSVGDLIIAKPLFLWINDGLMAIFFFLIGLELKREVLEGELSELSKVILPVIAAVGGMAIPALIYAFINQGDAVAMRGWAIPSATDIAFALAVLSLLGNKVPTALKLFLLTLAIVDDMGAIIIIALFYSQDLSVLSLSISGACLVILYIMNRRGVMSVAGYLLVGTIMWVSVLKSGVHATLAGVLLAFFIPLKNPKGESPLKELEHDLHPAVAYMILPLFAFANTGVPLLGLQMSDLFATVPLGIALGLFLGNQIGVFGFSYIAVKLGVAKLPSNVDWGDLYGVSMLCGIGFTMSLFISSLAFEGVSQVEPINDRIGILAGSFMSAVSGYLWLRWRLKNKAEPGVKS